MPRKGRPSFLLYENWREKGTDYRVSMPWKGRPPFLPPSTSKKWMRPIKCVNALKGATSISTVAPINIQAQFLKLCQCPERGDLHFYQKENWSSSPSNLCQCPERGDLHFYNGITVNFQQVHGDVSMPWKGRPPFLHNGNPAWWKISLLCQCPERGDLHFYRKGCHALIVALVMCQCPERGDLHFYRK